MVTGVPNYSATSALVLAYINEDDSWSKLRISYFIHSRTDMFCYSFMYSTAMFGFGTNGKITIDQLVQVPSRFVSRGTNNYFFTSLSGLKCNSLLPYDW